MSSISPYIISIGTSVPDHKVKQKDLLQFMEAASDGTRENVLKLKKVYGASGIETRHTIVEDFSKQSHEFDFFPQVKNLEPAPALSKRMNVFQAKALKLTEKAIEDCIQNLPGFNIKEITHLITFSCTGMYAPGLDIELVEKLEMNSSVERTCINFMGCYAAFNALKSAYHIARSEPNAKVLVAGVEICSIHFQNNNWDNEQLVANAVFSDGASAALVTTDETIPSTGQKLQMKKFHSEFISYAKDQMTWNIGDTGFNLKLSSYVPDLVKGGIADLVEKLYQKVELKAEDVSFFAIHPGGVKILEACEQALKITREDNKFSYDVLKNYGNMSSVTVLFVLKEFLKTLNSTDKNKNILSCAFGPGLTIESMILSVQ